MVSIFGVALCLSFSQSGHQNVENLVWGGTVYAKRTQGYAGVEHGLSKWSVKIKIGQANHPEVTKNGFYFWDRPMSRFFCNRAAKKVKSGLGVPLTTPRARKNIDFDSFFIILSEYYCKLGFLRLE